MYMSSAESGVIAREVSINMCVDDDIQEYQRSEFLDLGR